MPKAVRYKSKKGKKIVSSLFQTGGIVLFVGSAISQWPPTSIPTGMQLSTEIASLLAENFSTPERRSRAKNYVSKIPLEYLCERCPKPEKLAKIFPSLFYPVRQNAAHQSIINLVRRGVVQHIVTTNYDMGLEQALNRSNIRVISQRKDLRSSSMHSKILFKIHGSAAPGLEHTMIYRLSGEGELPKWKSRLLSKLVAGRNLLVMGYSGADFEITPQLVTINASCTVWVTRTHPDSSPIHVTHNANQVLDANNGIYIQGDILEILGIKNPGAQTTILAKRAGLRDLLNQNFSQEELMLWSCNVLVAPGYASYVEEISRVLQSRARVDGTKWANATRLLAEGLFSSGKYRMVGNMYLRVAKIFKATNRFGDYYKTQLKAVDSFRCFGAIPQAKKLLEETRRAIHLANPRDRKLILAKLDLQHCLILYQEYQWLRLFRPLDKLLFRQSALEVKQKFFDIAKQIAPVFARKGEWHDFQQLRMWSSRIGLDFDLIYSGNMQPPVDSIGWKRLGHKIQEMMAVRGDLVNSKGKMKIGKEEILELIATAEDMGCYPEVWKLTLTFAQYNYFLLLITRPQWVRAFFECEYAFLMRLQKLFFASH